MVKALRVALLVALLALFVVTASKPMTPCASDDGSSDVYPCLWDASTRGDHTGQSFIVDEFGNFHYQH